jgi:hypothetical protein
LGRVLYRNPPLISGLTATKGTSMQNDPRAPEWQILDTLKQILSELQAVRGLLENKTQAPETYAYDPKLSS